MTVRSSYWWSPGWPPDLSMTFVRDRLAISPAERAFYNGIIRSSARDCTLRLSLTGAMFGGWKRADKPGIVMDMQSQVLISARSIDFAFWSFDNRDVPFRQLAVEIDGYQWHGDRNAFMKDRTKDRLLLMQAHVQTMRFAATEVLADEGKLAAEEVLLWLLEGL